jgi:hypothetical protein
VKTAFFLLLIAAGLMVGCGPEQAEMKTDPRTVMNPGGNEQNLPPEAQGTGAREKAAAEAAGRNMDEMSRQMEAARRAAGGK